MTAFIDKAHIHVKSGAGGNGIVAWRREKFVPQGGPAGGDGGKGGDVVIEATDDLNTLLDLKYQSIFKAEDGEKGRNKNQYGKSGKDLVIRVPCGTIVRDADSGDAIADLTLPGQRTVVAVGGRGGRGNSKFLSSRRQAPQFAEPGEPGIERELELELKLIADVGIIGLPNAGKSTLISVISAAKPKIANYPFTTLVPNLGVVRKPNGDGIVVADIPGLVEGASQGIGLGHEFLRHVERTRLLVHLVDVTAAEESVLNTPDVNPNETDSPLVKSPLENYQMIIQELGKYSPKLAQKPQVLALNKIDAVLPETVEQVKTQFRQAGIPVNFIISAATRQHVDELMREVFKRLEELPADEQVVELVPDYKAFDNDDSAFEIHHKGKHFYVIGGKIERLFSVTDMRNRAAVHRLMNILNAMGVYEELAKMGAKEGDTIHMAGQEFDYYPDDLDEPITTVIREPHPSGES